MCKDCCKCLKCKTTKIKKTKIKKIKNNKAPKQTNYVLPSHIMPFQSSYNNNNIPSQYNTPKDILDIKNSLIDILTKEKSKLSSAIGTQTNINKEIIDDVATFETFNSIIPNGFKAIDNPIRNKIIEKPIQIIQSPIKIENKPIPISLIPTMSNPPSSFKSYQNPIIISDPIRMKLKNPYTSTIVQEEDESYGRPDEHYADDVKIRKYKKSDKQIAKEARNLNIEVNRDMEE